jgi:hypothetical protein
VQESWVAWSGDGENWDVCCGAPLSLLTAISSSDCIPTGSLFLFSMNRKSEALVLCKMDITNSSIDLIDNTFEIAMFTTFVKSKRRWNRRNTYNKLECKKYIQKIYEGARIGKAASGRQKEWKEGRRNYYKTITPDPRFWLPSPCCF